MSNNAKKVLFSTDRFDVIEKDGRTGVEPHYLSVAILPFIRDMRGLPLQLGIIKEYNKIKSKDTYTVITGRVEGEDPDVLAAAQSKMLELSGLDLQEPERWFYLGFIQTHKMVNQDMPCFACDITGMQINDEEDDEEDVKKDEKVEFMIVGVNQALDTDDCYIPTIFMKMFRYIFGHATEATEAVGTQKSNVKNSPEQQDIIDIEGVVGAGTNQDGWIIHIKQGADKDAISSRVKSILGEDVLFKIEVQTQSKSE